MCSFKSIYFLIFVLNLYKTNAQISDKRLCVDLDCKEPISLAKTLLRYSSRGPGILSFNSNEQVTVFSKEASSVSNLWGVEINGKRGYIPKDLVREYKVFKKPKLLVDTELKQKSQVPVDKDKDNLNPNKVQTPYEVVDGTTFYLNPQDSISPSSTESPVVPTTIPPGTNEVEDKTKTKVEGLKEDETTAKKTEEESVVDNVISSISKWMKDDPTSDENDEAEDDEDDDEEDDEDEEDLEENRDLVDAEGQSHNDSVLQEPEDLNSLHNLPSGILISSYSLQIGTNTSQDGDGTKVQKVPRKEDSNVDADSTGQLLTKNASTKAQALPSTNGDVEMAEVAKTEVKSDISLANNGNVTVAPEFQAETDAKASDSSTSNEKLSKPEASLVSPPVPRSSSVATDKISPVGDVKQTETNPGKAANIVPQKTLAEFEKTDSEILDERKAEADDKNNFKDGNIESVTEPALEEEEQLSILDEVTPNPVAAITKEFKTGELADQTPPPQQEVEGSKSPEVNVVDSSVPEEQSLNQPQNSLTDSLQPTSLVEPPQTADQISKGQEVSGSLSHSPLSDLLNAQKIVNPTVENQNEESKEDYVQPSGKNEAENEISKDDLSEILMNDIEQNEEMDVSYDSSSEDQNVSEDIKVKEQVEEENGQTEITSEEAVSIEDDNNAEDSKESVGREEEDNGGFFSNLLSLFGGSNVDPQSESAASLSNEESVDTVGENIWSPKSKEPVIKYCDASVEMCNTSDRKDFVDHKGLLEDIELSFSSDIFLYLLTTSISVIVFLFGYMILDRSRRETPLVARINKLEKQLLITLKENELLQEKASGLAVQEIESISNDVVEQLTQQLAEVQLANQALESRVFALGKELESKEALEEQIENLEKELETSTEVGMELNRIISEMLDPTNGSEKLKENVEQLQRQLLEQKDTINTISMTLKEKESENQAMQLEVEKSKKKSVELQSKLEEMVDKVLQIEKEKDQQQATLQNEIAVYHQKYNEAVNKVELLNNEIQILRVQLAEVQRKADIKTREHKMLQDSVEKIKSMRNDKEALRSLLDTTSIKAELQQLKSENENYTEQLQHEQSLKLAYEKKYQTIVEEVNLLHQKYEQADKEKVEANSRLEVLNNYFKKREAELQEEVIKYKSIWEAKEGEATSTTERIKYMQEEIENYKAQNETLKQEIISQEIDLKSQISMLEKKVHENWVTARQTERKLEDAKQEAAQLRNRLTLRERAINEERSQNRLQSPAEQNGELPLSPHPIDSPASPPLLYGGRDHITKSPPIPGLPPFLPPPPGAPFMPPPLHGMPPFMPPPPSMFPGDHRPPPLGRMSSPPLNSRYSPDTSAFSPYDRNSPSPPYDSEYGTSPPPIRGYSPYNSRDDRRDYKRPPHVRTNGRNMKGSVISSGSEHSNDSLDKINRKQSKKV